MSDKPMAELNPIDRAIRSVRGVGMESGTIMTIERIVGFELFNTRPYHNFETWSDGWRVSGDGITTSAEDLDAAVDLWIAAKKAAKVEIPA